jgi:hypothetical protein
MHGIIYGKGPSLLQWDFAAEPEQAIRVGINDAAYFAPRCDYLAMHDRNETATVIMRRATEKHKNITALLPGFFAPQYGALFYTKTDMTISLNRTNQTEIWGGTCTGHSAFHWLWKRGCDEIKMVGFDGGKIDREAYLAAFPACAVAMRAQMEGDENWNAHWSVHYAKQRKIFEALATILNVKATFAECK